MPQSSIFQWRDGKGWLVFSGSSNFRSDAMQDIDAQVLSRTHSNGELALVWSAGDIEKADRYLEHITELGGRTGYLLDIVNEQSPSDLSLLTQAGIILFMDGGRHDDVFASLEGDVLNALATAFLKGATIYAQGRLCAMFSSYKPAPLLGIQSGLGWLENAIISAPYQPDEMQQWLSENMPSAFGVGIQDGSALALSADGGVEQWGQPQGVTVVLGQGLSN